MKALPPLWSACRFCGDCAVHFALWTLWLLLGALLAFQLYLLAARQIPVPPFLLRAFESRLAASHLVVRFDRATFDPSGRIFAENIRLTSPSFAEPLFTARAVYVRLDPWALLAGHFDPREARVADAAFFVPAPLSPSGQAEALIRDCTVDLVPHERDLDLVQFSCRAGTLPVTAHGVCRLPVNANAAATGILPLADLFAANYPRLSREFAGYVRELGALDDAQLHLELVPSETNGATVVATLGARAFSRETPWNLQATGIHLSVRAPLLGNAGGAALLDLRAAALELPGRARAQAVHLRIRGAAWPGRMRFVPRVAEFSAAVLEGSSLHAADCLVRCTPGPLPRLHAAAALRLAGGPVGLDAELDLKTKSGEGRLEAALAPALLVPVGAWLHSDLPGLLQLTSPIGLQGSATFAAGWRFDRASFRFEAGPLVAQDVPLDSVSAKVDFHDHDLTVSDIALHQHENAAFGSYVMDTATRDYRFLLHGRLRPLDDAAWFAPSWSTFWKKFEFPAGPVAADVDVRGRWGSPMLTDVFVFADAVSPVARGVPLDRMRALLRWQPDRYDCREFFIAQGARTARGRFTRTVDLVKDTWRDMDFDGTSNLDPVAGARIIAGQEGEDFVAPFKFAQ
ncbi:MAG TPA: hypothetical protein VFB27_07345, partial [Opitutaceae bacterium]|nr:hypothetical protein [Opitutaceae bacterium]